MFQNLLRAFFENISSPQAVFRRAAANMILATCINCRKPQFFLNYVLEYMLGMLNNYALHNTETFIYYNNIII